MGTLANRMGINSDEALLCGNVSVMGNHDIQESDVHSIVLCKFGWCSNPPLPLAFLG